MRFLSTCLLSLFAASALVAQDPPKTPPTTTTSTVKPFTPADSARFMALGKRAIDFMLHSKADSLIAMMAPDDAAAMGGLEGATDNMSQMDEKIGKVTKVLVQKLTRRNGLPQFWFEADFTNFTDEPVVIRFVFSEEGKLVGLGANPKSMAKFDNL